MKRNLNQVRACAIREGQTMASLLIYGTMLTGCFLLGLVLRPLSPSPESIPYLLLQGSLVGVTLVSVLLGLFSARDEPAEQPTLFSQPLSIPAYCFGKLTVRAGTVSGGWLLVVGGSGAGNTGAGTLFWLWMTGTSLALVFVLLGLLAGFYSSRPVQGLGWALGIWVLLLYGVDLLAIGLAKTAWIQQMPWIWVIGLLLSPVDLVRLIVLNRLENLFAEGALMQDWLIGLFQWIGPIGLVSHGLWIAVLFCGCVWVCRRQQW